MGRRTASCAGSAALAAALLTAGCSDPKAPNDANFRKVLEPLVRDRFCRGVDARRMSLASGSDVPPPFPIIVPATPTSFGSDAPARTMLEQAAAAGLLTRKVATQPAKRAQDGEELKPTALIFYEPTAKGAQIFRPVDRRLSNGQMAAFPAMCMGTGRIDSIVRWTDPGDAFGQTVTVVTYTYSATDVPADAPPRLREELARPKEAQATLVRASDGWQLMGR